MLGRLAERLVTGPGAFFVAGAIDVAALFAGALRRRLSAGLAGRGRRRP